jgi:hypothetical protein
MNGEKRTPPTTVKRALFELFVALIQLFGSVTFLLLQIFFAFLLGFAAIVGGLLGGTKSGKGGRW